MSQGNSGTSPQLPVYARIAQELAARARKNNSKDPFPPSVRDVAGQFGVSIVTASRAIQVLKERINNADHGNATSADVGKWYVALNITPGPHQVAGVQVAREGFQKVANESKAGFLFDTIPLGNGQTAQAVQLELEKSQVRGVYLLPSRISEETLRQDEMLMEACRKLKLPVVLIERNLRGLDRSLEHDLVTIHDYDGGRKVTAHLLSRGRKKIGFVSGSPTSSHQERLSGYLSVMFEAALQPQVFFTSSDTPPRMAYTKVAEELKDAQVDAVVCYHDHAAFGIIMELLRRGVSVPGQVAVAGFDNMAICESFSIGVTSYAFPYDLVARRAADLMHLRLQRPESEPVKMVVPGQLIIRESTAGFDSPALDTASA